MHDAPIYFWQNILTPHMADLAEMLAVAGNRVVYVANQLMSADRRRIGWAAPSLNYAVLHVATDETKVTALAWSAPANSIHLCQGLRGNGLVRIAQQILAERELQQWSVMETVDDGSTAGLLKRVLYRWLLWRYGSRLQGILAIGWKTTDWLAARGLNRNKIFPFAYFFPDALAQVTRSRANVSVFRFLFVGQLIKRKRVDHLLQALAVLNAHDFELVIIGDGPMRLDWEAQANRLLPNRVHWLGSLPMAKIPQKMANADCLVLPSRHDGWGAVVSEALMVGTPVICSDACGSAGAVHASGFGGVFPRDDVKALSALLEFMLDRGVLSETERYRSKKWARSLGAEAGAQYLIELFTHAPGERKQFVPNWLQ